VAYGLLIGTESGDLECLWCHGIKTCLFLSSDFSLCVDTVGD